MRPQSWYIAAAVGSAAWSFLVSWLGRDVDCGVVDGCGLYALLLIVGLSAILLASSIGLARKMDRLAWQWLAALATSFTVPGVLAMIVYLYLTDYGPAATTIGAESFS
jgi:hypothetical protein